LLQITCVTTRSNSDKAVSDSDRRRWDARYAADDPVMGAAPKPLVLELEPLLPRRGRALDIACGEGQLALWLAQRGLDVTAVDISPMALDKLRALAAAAGLVERIDVLEVDLDDGLPPLAPGLTLVTCIDFHAPEVIARARDLLAPGGMLLVQVLLQARGGDRPFRVAPGEALCLARDLRLRFYREGVMDGRALAQLLAQREPAELPTFSG
jgi:SAM-dependent methyltransferase